LANPSDAERRAVAALLGSASGGRHLSVDLDALALIATRGGRFASLRQWVEAAHGGPVEDRRARRSAERERWDALWDGVLAGCYESAPLCQWLVRLRASGRVGRCSGRDLAMAGRLLGGAVDVVERLPLSPPAPLARLAADLFGDSTRWIWTEIWVDWPCVPWQRGLVSAAADSGRSARHLDHGRRGSGRTVGHGACPQPARRAGTLLGDALSFVSEAREPCRVTFRQLRLSGHCRFDRAAHDRLYVCENPSIVAAAADDGTRDAARC